MGLVARVYEPEQCAVVLDVLRELELRITELCVLVVHQAAAQVPRLEK